MGTKNNPGKYDCYAKAEPDEPMFVLLGRDPAAPRAVREWADHRELQLAHRVDNDSDSDRLEREKIAEARACANAMEAYQDSLTPVGRAAIAAARDSAAPAE